NKLGLEDMIRQNREKLARFNLERSRVARDEERYLTSAGLGGSMEKACLDLFTERQVFYDVQIKELGDVVQKLEKMQDEHGDLRTLCNKVQTNLRKLIISENAIGLARQQMIEYANHWFQDLNEFQIDFSSKDTLKEDWEDKRQQELDDIQDFWESNID